MPVYFQSVQCLKFRALLIIIAEIFRIIANNAQRELRAHRVQFVVSVSVTSLTGNRKRQCKNQFMTVN